MAIAGSLLLGFGLFASANGEMKVCTREYNPVCGQKEVQCITAPCNPVQQTYGNACTAEADGAEVISQGECKQNTAPMTDQEIVSRAYDKGLTSISKLTDFSYNSKVTREQAAKMIVNAMENANIDMWTIKLPAGSCEWMDVESIDKTLLASVNQSCKLGLFRGDRGNFIPYAPLTAENLETVITRAIQYIPNLREFFNSKVSENLTSRFVTRGELVRALYAITDFIKTAGGKYAQHQMNLDKARDLWEKSKITQYEFVQTRTCFCPTDYTRAMKYNVNNNSIVGLVTYQDNGSIVSGDKYEGLMTVESAFDLIQDSIDNNVASIIVEYDPTYGYPTKISIDTSEMIADEEMYYTFSLVNKTPASTSLVGNWHLTDYNGVMLDRSGITLSLDTNNRASARICNSIGATYTLNGNMIMFSNMMSTLMACSDEKITNMESAFNNFTSVEYMLSGSTLTLKSNMNTWVWMKN